MNPVFLLFFICCSFISMTEGHFPVPTAYDKLQISVTRHIPNCIVRSREGDILNIYYTGFLQDGTVFDSAYEPVSFTLGSGQFIKGLEQGMSAMCEGEQRMLLIPPDLAYGEAGSPPNIPKSATLVFYVELIVIGRHSEL